MVLIKTQYTPLQFRVILHECIMMMDMPETELIIYAIYST